MSASIDLALSSARTDPRLKRETGRVTNRPANRLATETSPYLLQHAHNPVDWYPWGEEAFARARAEDKPILLSVGYAACHWCHVMERESFEDEATAAQMNADFVAVKVDREERPDVDAIYMDAVQAMTGSGGWPMTAFLTPEGDPFYAGTYFPPEPRHGMPAFRQVLAGIAEAWRDRRPELIDQSAKVVAAIGRAATLAGGDGPLDDAIAARALERLRGSFDPRWGGFGGAPKFPQPTTLGFVLRRAVRGDPGAREMVATTLDRMAWGGIHDQVGGGFARYATDAAWHVPHFEKMLYDNAQLAQLYVRAWQVTGREGYRSVATGVLDFLLRELRHPEGGFWSSLDADSEGAEGRFYVWSWHELTELVGPETATALGASPDGNWEGTNVLWFPQGPDLSDDRLADARRLLFTARSARVRPATDDKVLTSWNAMAIAAFAEAGRAMQEPAYVEAAEACAAFIWASLRDGDGRLLRSWREGAAGRPGFADDHALLASALLTLYETTFDLRWFEAARSLADVLLDRFVDRERGGFFQTADDAERLVVRPKELYDNATPSGNSAAAEVLLRLAGLTGDDRYGAAAEGALGLVAGVLDRAPTAFGYALSALDRYLGPGREVAIVGDPDLAETRALIRAVTGGYRPNVSLAVARPDDTAAEGLVPLLRDRTLVEGRPAAYVCERFACRLPVTEPSAVQDALAG
jgi:uncharacterized protein YyaL (SSP411 family)